MSNRGECDILKKNSSTRTRATGCRCPKCLDHPVGVGTCARRHRFQKTARTSLASKRESTRRGIEDATDEENRAGWIVANEKQERAIDGDRHRLDVGTGARADH